MAKLMSLIMIALSSVISLAAQNSPVEIIQRSLDSVGPKSERKRVKSIHAIADCFGPNGKYITEIDSASGSRLVFRQARTNGAPYVGIQNGASYWTRGVDGEIKMADAKTGFVWHSHDYQRIALEIGNYFRDYTFGGEEKVAGIPAWKLNAKDELGNDAAVFFAKSDGLLVGFAVRNPFSAATEMIRTVFSEWKQVGKLKLPSVATATDKTGDFVLRFREIRINRSSDDLFAVPAKVVAMTEILEVHNRARAAHFRRDAALLLSSFADGFADIRNGSIARPTRESSLSRFENYFRNSEFVEWDDIDAPVIEVSDDATLAYTLVHKRVRLRTKNADGAEIEEFDVFSWIATYRKIRGEWKLTAIASTRAPK
ncbi:MAG: hypothetical protein IPN69_19220 [Acidobacteria bacterium]|nr:hypothetical protein [Acidobacteriota bacterium]